MDTAKHSETAKGQYPEANVYLKTESEALIGCAMHVHNELGYGFHEKPYENALVIEIQRQKIQHTQQPTFDIAYQGVNVGKYIPDLIAFGKIIIDTKVIENISELEVGQMLNYLKITGLKLGYIINFKHPRLQWKRIIL